MEIAAFAESFGNYLDLPFVLLLSHHRRAGDEKEETTTMSDEQSLRDIVSGLEAAWNRGDSIAWAGFFAEDADFIHVLGGHFNGRTVIEKGHRAIFDTIYKGSTNKFTVKKVRLIGGKACLRCCTHVQLWLPKEPATAGKS